MRIEILDVPIGQREYSWRTTTDPLAPDALTDRQLRRIAAAAAGDARVGLSILRSAARHADRVGTDAITDAHIEEAIPAARQEVRSKNLDALRPAQRLVFEILQDAGELPLREIYERYTSRVEDPRTKRTVRSWLGKLAKYNLVEASGNGPNRTYRVRAQFGDGD